MASKTATATIKKDTKKEPAAILQNLDHLAGEWKTDTEFKNDPDNAGMGSVKYEWLDGRYYLMGYFENGFTKGNVHKGIWVIGYDEEEEGIKGHFFDSMGNHREYVISLEGSSYTITGDRERYSGEIVDDVITGVWEKSSDGRNWEYLCDEKMTRVRN